MFHLEKKGGYIRPLEKKTRDSLVLTSTEAELPGKKVDVEVECKMQMAWIVWQDALVINYERNLIILHYTIVCILVCGHIAWDCHNK